MKKVTLVFPTQETLWSFKGMSHGINVTIIPIKNTMTGLFTADEVGIAIFAFKAIQTAAITDTSNSSIREESIGKRSLLRATLLHFLASLF